MKNESKIIERPPVVVVMGHVDHGKSALLDYIRKSNVVAGEAGGITQHISAYEVTREHDGKEKRITFLDTPGHEAFGKMRAHGARTADIAILVVSAEDGVKQQTLDALKAIKDAGIPFCVAINKIDLPGANITQTQSSLVEHEVYIEGMGGDIPWNAISAKTGEGINDLLDTVLLIAEMEELTADSNVQAGGVVIEAHRDPKSGVTASLLIKHGTLRLGEKILAGTAAAPVRAIEDFQGKKIKEATFSSPIAITGFDELPKVGLHFEAYADKKELEKARLINKENLKKIDNLHDESDDRFLIPIILKVDVTGTIDAINHELNKINDDTFLIKAIKSEAGDISEGDVQSAIGTGALIVGFNVKVDGTAKEVARQHELEIHTFDIIYKMAEWLESTAKKLKPKIKRENELAVIKILKHFSTNKNIQVVGGKVKSGDCKTGLSAKVLRRNEHISDCVIKNLQSLKQSVEHVSEGTEFGAQVECDIELVEGDHLHVFEIIED